ncbi:MBL fold metallo-hydrolase [Wenxinia marina]|uniref:Zn-dependent hydrolase n=1 Tax=Wenxinia marina DSM 24838 TaxID=1123501 RepID=A0A0D0Q7C2_9RHOB|nr:MBL fold metallo-hydrolase [Wenxinia marina]KIQ70334.1 Zn-dependent hydrolase [Wenxinia marina DSM 24838]GGL53936.1 MBL fold hydrolase [Wenxinia marina]
MPDDGASAIRTPWAEGPEEGRAIEVADGVLWLRLPVWAPLNHVNVYALEDGDGWALVDAGLATEAGRAAWAALLAGPLQGRPVTRMLVTHSHPDHVGMAGAFARDGAELLTSRTAFLMSRMLTLDVQERPSEAALGFYRRSGMDPELLARRMGERPMNFADMVELLPPTYTRLAEGDALSLGGRTWDVRMGDGHAPEHVTLWARDEALVIGGDQLLPTISPNLGVHPTEPEADPVADFLQANARLAVHATDEQLILPGHRLPYRGLPIRLEQLRLNHEGALRRLEAHLAEPRRGGECFPALFRREIGAGEYGLALAETIGHLNHLTQTGRARRWLGEDGAYRWRAAGRGGGAG